MAKIMYCIIDITQALTDMDTLAFTNTAQAGVLDIDKKPALPRVYVGTPRRFENGNIEKIVLSKISSYPRSHRIMLASHTYTGTSSGLTEAIGYFRQCRENAINDLRKEQAKRN